MYSTVAYIYMTNRETIKVQYMRTFTMTMSNENKINYKW